MVFVKNKNSDKVNACIVYLALATIFQHFCTEISNLNICKSSELESTFIEILNLKKSNIIGCIYNHPSLDLNTYYHQLSKQSSW